MAIVYDPQRTRYEDWRTFCYDHRDEIFTLQCIEGDVDLNGRWLLINLVLLQPLIKRHRPISRDRHLYLSGIYSAKLHSEIMTRISQSLEEHGYDRDALAFDMIMTVNDMHNLGYTHLGNYIRTMDMFSIAKTYAQPEVRKACTVDYGDLNDHNIHRVEKIFSEKCAEARELLTSDRLDFNIFRAPLICNALKPAQFDQFAVSAGPRTDTDDKIFGRPVVGSFLSGLCDGVDMIIESRASAKSTHYNKTQMSNVQYSMRKIHLLNSAVRFLYAGENGQRYDCGSEVYMDYMPTKNTVERYLGKFYLNEQNELTELTKDRFGDVVGRWIKMRDGPLCRYTDGFCETCGGTITRSFPRVGNVGFLSNVNTGAPMTQMVLSTKHLQTTRAASYRIPSALDNFLRSDTSDIYIRNGVRSAIHVLALGFNPNDIARINDLKHWVSDNDLIAACFTDIKYMQIGKLRPDGTVQDVIKRESMKGEADIYPHLSASVLEVIRKYPEDIVIQDKIAWLLMRHVDPQLPVMQCTVVNNSVKRLVKRFTDLVTKDIEKYTSLNTVMHVLTDLIWNEGNINTHITHISTLVRACLVTNKHDFHIPVVTDPDNVKFGSLNRIVPMRSIGALLAYEKIDQATNSFVNYIVPKQTGTFDEFLGYSDSIVTNMEYPVKTGAPIEYEQLSSEQE